MGEFKVSQWDADEAGSKLCQDFLKVILNSVYLLVLLSIQYFVSFPTKNQKQQITAL